MAAVTAAHAAFLTARRSYIGGTDIAAITGVSPWASPLSVYLDKTAPEQAERSDSLPMRRGLALERFIADEFERAYPRTVCYHPSPIVRTDWGFPAGASVDRFVATVDHPRTPIAVLECKTAFGFQSARQWSEAEADLPDSYYVQVQWYLAVTGLDLAYGAADTGREKLTVIPIASDPAVQARLIEAGRAFWQEHVERGVPPEPSGTDADGEALESPLAGHHPRPAGDDRGRARRADPLRLPGALGEGQGAPGGGGQGQAAPPGPDGRARDGAHRQLAPLLEAPEPHQHRHQSA